MACVASAGRLRVGVVLAMAASLAVQFVVLYDPSPPGGVVLFAGADKIIHALVFAAPAALAALAGSGWHPGADTTDVAYPVLRSGWPRWPIVVLVALIIHAPLSEVVQAQFLVHRGGDPWDAVADLFGVALGVSIAVTLVWMSRTVLTRRERTTPRAGVGAGR